MFKSKFGGDPRSLSLQFCEFSWIRREVENGCCRVLFFEGWYDFHCRILWVQRLFLLFIGPYGYRLYSCLFCFLLFFSFSFFFFIFQTLLNTFLVCWPYFWYVDHISGTLTIFLVYWTYFWYVDLISGMLTISLVCSPYFWYFDHINSVNYVL